MHMRMGLFRTNTTYVDSFSAEPQYELIAMAHEVELVNIDVGLVQANLTGGPYPLVVGQLYAIGVWTDAIIYGPAANWGVDASGLPMPYTQIDQDGTMPQTAYALGGQTLVQLMGVNMCAANNQLISYNWCATFGEYRLTIFGWMLIKRYYAGQITALNRPMYNSFGTYRVATAGNGTYSEVWWGPIPDPYTPPHPERLPVFQILNGTWNMNNFQVLSPNYFYDVTNSTSGLYLDDQGMQVIINLQYDDWVEVYATIINAVRPRGSPEWFYQEAQEFDYYDTYQPVSNTNNKFIVTQDGSQPVCPVDYVPWNAVLPYGSQSFLVACTGLAQIQSTHGDNRIFDFVNRTEGNMIQANTLYNHQLHRQCGHAHPAGEPRRAQQPQRHQLRARQLRPLRTQRHTHCCHGRLCVLRAAGPDDRAGLCGAGGAGCEWVVYGGCGAGYCVCCGHVHADGPCAGCVVVRPAADVPADGCGAAHLVDGVRLCDCHALVLCVVPVLPGS